MQGKGQATERRTDLERDINAPPSAPEGVGGTNPETDGARKAYSHVAGSTLAPPIPFPAKR
jgi:hypothetical protein